MLGHVIGGGRTPPTSLSSNDKGVRGLTGPKLPIADMGKSAGVPSVQGLGGVKNSSDWILRGQRASWHFSSLARIPQNPGGTLGLADVFLLKLEVSTE
jgi:hypothetical protein